MRASQFHGDRFDANKSISQIMQTLFDAAATNSKNYAGKTMPVELNASLLKEIAHHAHSQLELLFQNLHTFNHTIAALQLDKLYGVGSLENMALTCPQ